MADDLDDAVSSPDVSDIAKALASELFSIDNLQKLETTLINAGVQAPKIITAGLVSIGADIFAVIAKQILEGVQLADPAIGDLAAVAVNALFGTSTSGSDFQLGGNGRDALGDNLANTILQRFGGAATAPLSPSDVAAKQYLSTIIKLDVEGWLIGALVEAVSSAIPLQGIGHLEQFGELKDVVASSLGLGRLSRSVLRPFIDATVVTPFKWTVHKTYTPELLPPALAVQQFFRGVLSHDQLVEELARQGWSADRVEAHIAQARKRDSLDDIIWSYLHGMSPIEAVNLYATEAGYEKVEIDIKVQVARDKLLQPLLEQIYREYEAAYIDGHTDAATVASAASTAYQDPGIAAIVTSLADAKRAARKKRISKADIEACVKLGIASTSDYRQWLQEENYDDDSALWLELKQAAITRNAEEVANAKAIVIAQKAATKAAAAAARAAALEAKKETLAAVGPGLSAIEALVVDGILPIQRYATAAAARGYSADDVTALVAGVQEKRDARLATQAQRATLASQAAAKQLNVSELEQSVEQGLMSEAAFTSQLHAAGFTDDNINVLLGLVRAKIASTAAAKTAHDAAAAAAAKKGLNLAESENAVLAGVWTLAQFADWLKQSGFDDVTATVLENTLQAKLTARQAANATHATVSADLATKNISLADLETAVIHGIRPIADVQTLLVQQRYALTDQTTLLQLLQEKIDAYQVAQKKKAAVLAATSTKPLSYAQVERAVLTGVLTPADAGDYLTREGYGADDVVTLQQLLTDELAQQSTLPAIRTRVAAAVAAVGKSLTTLERDVVAGTTPIASYDALLRSVNVADADRTALVTALQQQLDQTSDAVSLETSVAATLKARNLSLADWKAAVKANLRTMDDYRAFLLAQGFSPEDAAVLVALLQKQIDAAAAKAAPAPSTTSTPAS